MPVADAARARRLNSCSPRAVQAELVIGSTRRGAYVSQPLQPGHCQ